MWCKVRPGESQEEGVNAASLQLMVIFVPWVLRRTMSDWVPFALRVNVLQSVNGVIDENL